MNSRPKIYHWLCPLSFLYGLGVRARNRAFDCGWLKQESFGVPTICVGNLAVGGTGKTPHTELLVRLLQPHYKVAVLSRGSAARRAATTWPRRPTRPPPSATSLSRCSASSGT